MKIMKEELERKPHGKGGTIHGDDEQCPGCSATAGELHDWGCDWEKCPICAEQLIACEHS